MFDFVEICGGVGAVSRAASELGMVVAPVLDLSESRHYDLRDLRFLEWAVHMVETGRFASFLVEPPCTSFSAAAHPAVRSYKEPLGFCRAEEKTLHGNTLAFRSFVLLKVGRRKRRPCGLEQPHLSKMAWTTFWQTLLAAGFFESIIASCQFGSPHKKEFRFLLYLLDCLDVRCPGGHSHLRVEGKWTKGSAVYVPGLAMHVAKGFHRALLRLRRAEASEVVCEGFESLVINDLMSASEWKLEKSWNWKRKSHINVLEEHSTVAALGIAGLREPDSRHCFVVDSMVSRGALAKGRSSAYSLQPGLKRACALQIAFGLFPVWTFSPTRLNVADDPTRQRELREQAKRSLVVFWDKETIAEVHSNGLRRFAANWCRLTILMLQVVPAQACEFGRLFDFWTFDPPPDMSFCGDGERCLPGFRWTFPIRVGLCLMLGLGGLILWTFLFGFSERSPVKSRKPTVAKPPGIFRLLFGVLLVLGSKLNNPLNLWVLGSGFLVSSAAAMEPENPAERKRAALRALLSLPADRVVRKETRFRRQQLILAFRSWLWKNHQVSLRSLLDQKPTDAELISHWLVQYGRAMFGAGKSYSRYSETINGVAMLKPLIKKQLTPAWDLAFAWLSDEPHEHHPALPASVLLAILSVALCWGWVYEAAVLSLAWAGILRIGEVLQAYRGDLVLPTDCAPGQSFVLLKIFDPKTRGRSARHQSARVDQPDIIRLLVAVYSKADSTDKLWPFSACTLRKRFSTLLGVLGLAGTNNSNGRPFDLASLRPGGATHLLNLTENSELVRRRGRWLSHRVMEIYLQEIQVATCLQKIPLDQRQKILCFARCFENILETIVQFLHFGIPTSVWFTLLKGQRFQESEEDGRCGTEQHQSCNHFECTI